MTIRHVIKDEKIFLWKILFGSAIKINQKIRLLKLPWLTTRGSSRCKLEIQQRKVPAAMCGIGKKETTQGVFVLCLNSAAEGEKESGGREGIRSFSQLPSLRPQIWRFSWSSRYQPSVLVCHYFTSRRVHSTSQTHIDTLTPPSTVCVVFFCFECCQNQTLYSSIIIRWDL